MVKEEENKGVLLGKYELGRTLGEGNFGKVKYAKDLESGKSFAVKILEKKKILELKVDDQIKREIGSLKLLKHPNVVRLYEVLASKTKIFMVLEYVTGGELFDKIASKRRFSEDKGRKLFHQLIDAVCYCHDKGVFHRDLKPENILLDDQGNIKISDFGLSALPQHFWKDGLLHTTCGSPNYVAPEVLANRGYNGAISDIWSCGVILYVMLTGYLPFDDRNLTVLYQKIIKGNYQIPKWLSPGVKNLMMRILDPNPMTRIDANGIKMDDWFKVDYTPAHPNDEDDNILIQEDAFCMKQLMAESDSCEDASTLINAFQLIGMSSCLDLSGFFEKEDVAERKIRFTSNYSRKDLLEKIEMIVTDMGFNVQKRKGKLKVILERKDTKNLCSLSIGAEVFELSPTLYVVELRKSHGDSSLYRELCKKLSNNLGVGGTTKVLTSRA